MNTDSFEGKLYQTYMLIDLNLQGKFMTLLTVMINVDFSLVF